MKGKTLTIRESDILKGISILMIMFHNFFHQMVPKTGENEFNFDPRYIENFLNFAATNPLELFRHSFSFLGHYGVQIFILISGYGLYMGYQNRATPWWPFMKKRLNKLYPTLVIGIIFIITLYVLNSGRLPSVFLLKESLLKLTLLHNFIPYSATSVSGPWWFFALIVQLYVFFPFFKNMVRYYGPKSMWAVILFFLILTIAIKEWIHIPGVNVNHTFIAHVPVFALGIYFASAKSLRIHPIWILLSLAVFILGNFYKEFWYFSFLAVTIIMLVGMMFIIRKLEKLPLLNSFLAFTGSISLFLFVIHGSLRLPFLRIAELYPGHPLLEIALSFVFVAVSYFFALVIRIVEKQVQEFIASGYKFSLIRSRLRANKW